LEETKRGREIESRIKNKGEKKGKGKKRKFPQ
jgi:hypothetical protein